MNLTEIIHTIIDKKDNSMKKNLVYTLMLAGAVTMTACSKDELPNNILDASSSEVRFTGAIKKQSEILLTTRAETPNPDNYITLNETNENFGTFFIWLNINDKENINTNFFQKYVKAEGEAGNLTVEGSTNNEDRLNWLDKTSEHTFYAWTEPYKTGTNGITGGVKMDHKSVEFSGQPITSTVVINDITGTVIYGTNKETDLEKFIVTQKGPLTYNDWGQDVALYFERPIAKIELVGITHINSDGSQDIIGTQNNFTCTINFPNMYNKATFNPANFGTENPILSTEDKTEDKGLIWNYSYNEKTNGSVLYVHPFKFGDENTEVYDDPGYFIVTAKFKEGEEEKNYAATLANLSKYTELKAGEHMKLWLYLRDGSGVGIGYQIIDWTTDGNKELPQYRIPGVYNENDAKRLLEALQKAANSSDTYTFPTGVEDLVVKTSGDDVTPPTYDINLFTHIDWSSIQSGTINIPDNCTLKGNGYNITLKEEVSISGDGKIENLYVNEKPYIPDNNSDSEGITQP